MGERASDWSSTGAATGSDTAIAHESHAAVVTDSLLSRPRTAEAVPKKDPKKDEAAPKKDPKTEGVAANGHASKPPAAQRHGDHVLAASALVQGADASARQMGTAVTGVAADNATPSQPTSVASVAKSWPQGLPGTGGTGGTGGRALPRSPRSAKSSANAAATPVAQRVLVRRFPR